MANTRSQGKIVRRERRGVGRATYDATLPPTRPQLVAGNGKNLPQQQEIEQLNRWLEIALNYMARGLSMFDSEQRLIVCNKLYRAIFDLPSELTQRGTPFADIIAHHVWKETGCVRARDRRQQGKWIAKHVAALSTGKSFSETRELKNGRIILVTNQPLPGGGWVDLQEDITERRQAEQQISWLARHDPLTELANRHFFREELEKAFETGKSFAVYYLDLDHFKEVNDTYGHPMGDALLKCVAKRLRNAVRQTDVVARLGGDEFALIRHNAPRIDQNDTLAQRILRDLHQPFDLQGQKLRIGASVGIAVAPNAGSTADAIMKHADVALYCAKTSGRGTHVVFQPDKDDALL